MTPDLIYRLRKHYGERDVLKEEAADALLAQQVCIEKMREAIGMWDRAETHEEIQAAEIKLIACLVPRSLDALQEHDADVCQEFANFLGIEKREDVVKWIVAVRKGE